MNTKRVIIIALVAIAVFTVIALPFISSAPERAARAGEQRIAVIYLSGSIQEGAGGFFGAGVTPRYVRSQLERAASDITVRGVVLRIDSPGGSIAASQEIAGMVRDYEKPIVASMADMAASGGYYIAAPCQGIVAQPGTMTGSIGVISTLITTDGLYEMLGIEVETFKSGEHKDMFSRKLTEEERLIMQEISDEAYRQFVNEVAEGRGMSAGEVERLATGQLYLGSQALELGLVDRLGGLEDAIDYLAELNDFDNPVRYEYPPPSVFSQFMDYGYSVLVNLEKALLGPELIMFEMLREGIPPEIRYQVY